MNRNIWIKQFTGYNIAGLNEKMIGELYERCSTDGDFARLVTPLVLTAAAASVAGLTTGTGTKTHGATG